MPMESGMWTRTCGNSPRDMILGKVYFLAMHPMQLANYQATLFHCIVDRYMARVMEVEKDDNEVLVHFERWNSRYDEYIKIDSERLRVLLPDRREALEKEKEKVKKVKFNMAAEIRP